MKNLKKLLAVVLVAAMVLGVGALSASAAFTDTANTLIRKPLMSCPVLASSMAQARQPMHRRAT